MKRKSCLLAVLVLVFALVFAPVSQTSAIKLIDEALLYFYGMNGIFHYNGEMEKCTPGDGGNQNYAGEQVWSDAESSNL